MNRCYIAGPMQGYPEHNFPLFIKVAGLLRAAGYIPINPVDINPDADTPWDLCLRQDIQKLVTCDLVAVLPNWEASRGACLEVHIAKELRMPVIPFHVLVNE